MSVHSVDINMQCSNGNPKLYVQKYRIQWQSDSRFQAWIQPVFGDYTMAACKFCQCTMKAHLKSLKVHAACVKHHTNTLGRQTIMDKDLEPTNPENNQRDLFTVISCDKVEEDVISTEMNVDFIKNDFSNDTMPAENNRAKHDFDAVNATEKHKLIKELCKSLASIASQAPPIEYRNRYFILQQLYNTWLLQTKVKLISIDLNNEDLPNFEEDKFLITTPNTPIDADTTNLETNLEEQLEKKFDESENIFGGSTEKQNQCNQCSCWFKSYRGLEIHRKIHKSDNSKRASAKKKAQCDKCGSEFGSKHRLKLHSCIHSDERPFKCDQCTANFRTKFSLGQHKLIHTRERPYRCTFCNLAMRDASALKKHIRVHTGEKPYLCTYCGKRFAVAFTLKVHIQTHTGERPYSCKICDKSFAHLNVLYSHERRHAGDKPYACNKCDKKFFDSGTFARHKRRHTGEKPYICENCGKAFYLLWLRSRHMKVHATS